MAKLQIGDKTIEVDDAFLSLSPQEQQSTVDEIEQSLGGAAPVQEQPQNWSDLPGNIPSDALNQAEGLYNMVRHPVQTAEGLADVATGGATNLLNMALPESMQIKPKNAREQEMLNKASALGKSLKEDWGSLAKAKQTIIKRPVGALLDASVLATGGGAALARVPMKGAMETSRVLSKSGEMSNPINLAAKPISNAIQSFKGDKIKPPTAEDWRAKKNALYDSAETGVGKIMMTRDHVTNLARGFNEVGRDSNKGGVLSSVTDDVYRNTNSVISKVNAIARDVNAGKVPPPTFGELEQMRQTLNASVSNSILPNGKLNADGAMSSRLVEKIDDLLINSPFKEARSAYRTMLKSEKIEKAFRHAELDAGSNYTQAGMERAIRGQFKKIAKEKNFETLFSQQERTLIEKVVKGGPIQNLFMRFGALAPRGGMSTMFNIATTYSNPFIGIPLGVGATAAKFGSTAQTLKTAKAADELVRSGGKPLTPRLKRLTNDKIIAPAIAGGNIGLLGQEYQ